VGKPQQEFATAIKKLTTMTFLHYMRTTFVGERARYSLMAEENEA
jgi:uncharacterized membrane protein